MNLPQKILKKLLCLCLVFFLGIGMGYLSEHSFSENAHFEAFTEKLFQSEVCSNTLTLHYSLAYPEKRGIEKPEISLGSVSSQEKDIKQTTRLCSEYEKQLKKFSYSKLSTENQITLDMLLLYFHTRASLGEDYILDEPLSPSLGIQAQLPVLLAEYSFYTKEDISDYLKLLGTVKPYFQSILSFEEQKSQEGCFMSDNTLDRIQKQCLSFIEDPENNYMDTIFAQKLKAFSNPVLNTKEQTQLCSYHHRLIKEQIIPAYQELILGLEKLRGTGKDSCGLAHFDHGQNYYLYLLQSQTGSYDSVEDIEKRLSRQLLNDLNEVQDILQSSPTLLSSLSEYSTSLSLTPEQMLESLSTLIKNDFPELENISYEIRSVHPSMKDFLSPAFYLTPPIDTQDPNIIYINDTSRTSSLELFGTLAHEGLPGHLYQTISFSRNDPASIRCLITSAGYVEGWATYIESYAYQYAAELMTDLSDAANATRVLWLNRSINLCLYSLSDIGIHYKGWDQAHTASFLRPFGITDTSTVSEIYQYIVETPGNYLKYYLGYLNFLDLRDFCKQSLGTDFDLKLFHEKLLQIGPVPFPVLKKYMKQELGIDTQTNVSLSAKKELPTGSSTLIRSDTILYRYDPLYLISSKKRLKLCQCSGQCFCFFYI